MKLLVLIKNLSPPKKTKTQSKVVKTARIITSEAVRSEVAEVERRKREKENKSRPIVLVITSKLTKNPYKGYYATVPDGSAHDEAEINYF